MKNKIIIQIYGLYIYFSLPFGGVVGLIYAYEKFNLVRTPFPFIIILGVVFGMLIMSIPDTIEKYSK